MMFKVFNWWRSQSNVPLILLSKSLLIKQPPTLKSCPNAEPVVPSLTPPPGSWRRESQVAADHRQTSPSRPRPHPQSRCHSCRCLSPPCLCYPQYLQQNKQCILSVVKRDFENSFIDSRNIIFPYFTLSRLIHSWKARDHWAIRVGIRLFGAIHIHSQQGVWASFGHPKLKNNPSGPKSFVWCFLKWYFQTSFWFFFNLM